MKYEIEYELRVVKKALVEANSKEEALKKYYQENFLDDWEEDVSDSKILDVQEVDY